MSAKNECHGDSVQLIINAMNIEFINNAVATPQAESVDTIDITTRLD